MIRGVPAAEIPSLLDSLKPFIEKFASISRGRFTVKTLFQDIMERDRQVWVAGDFQAVCMTSIGLSSVNIDFCAGVRAREWQSDLEQEIRTWAISLGKKRIFVTGRRGWERFGKPLGYREIERNYMLEL
ncbi:hypothetical protein [uncultured Ruegeria sp.]|uniref:hypothetical protein n=1 Tax=uncultured Ruegeria sp. TaxID=259304 RepID=UPI00261A6117|nr:hypothetical protein [uncultured Ruegeria sp.]